MQNTSFIDQLAQIKKNMNKPKQRNIWTDSEVYELLEKGETPLHSKQSCIVMLSLLKSNTSQRRAFCHVIRKWESETGKTLNKPIKRRSSVTKEDQEKIKRHIIPIGYTKQFCANWMTKNGYNIPGYRSQWSWESRPKAIDVEQVLEAVPSFAETVEKHETKSNELALNLQAIKVLVNAGMNFQQIAKIMGKEENLVIALIKVAEVF